MSESWGVPLVDSSLSIAISGAVLFAQVGAAGTGSGPGGTKGVLGGLDPPVPPGDGEGLGEGEWVGLGVGEGDGSGDGEGLGLGDGVGDGLSEGEGVGDGSATILISPEVSVCQPWS